VSVRFSDDTVRPADTVSISVAAHPASYVGLLAVDQSVLLLRQGNDITQDSVRCYQYNFSQSENDNGGVKGTYRGLLFDTNIAFK